MANAIVFDAVRSNPMHLFHRTVFANFVHDILVYHMKNDGGFFANKSK